MTQYLIRTEDDGTHILKLGENPKRLGFIYTDYYLQPDSRDISLEDILDPKKRKVIAQARLYDKKDYLSIMRKKRWGRMDPVASFNRKGEYQENGKVIPFRKVLRKALLKKEEYKGLEEMGVTHAYFVEHPSPLTQVFCFERDGKVSGTVHTRESSEDDLVIALKGFTLVMAQTIENQDYIRAFMKE